MDPIETRILDLVAARGPTKSICPSEVVRNDGPGWQSQLGAVRAAAVRLAMAGQIEITRHGKPIEPAAIKGVIRLRAVQDGQARDE